MDRRIPCRLSNSHGHIFRWSLFLISSRGIRSSITSRVLKIAEISASGATLMTALLMLFIVEVSAGFVLRVDLAQIGIVPANCSPELNYNAPPVCGNSICPLYYVNRRGDGDDKNDDGDESVPLTSLRGNRRQQAHRRHNRSKSFIEWRSTSNCNAVIGLATDSIAMTRRTSAMNFRRISIGISPKRGSSEAYRRVKRR